MSVNHIHRKLEGKLIAYLGSLGTIPGNADMLRAFDVSSGAVRVAFPCVSVRVTQSRPMSTDIDATAGATNRYASVEIAVRSWMADSESGGVTTQAAIDAHDDLAAWVADNLHTASLVADVNAASGAGVTVEQIDLPVVTGPDIEDGGIVTRFAFDVLCYGTEGGT